MHAPHSSQEPKQSWVELQVYDSVDLNSPKVSCPVGYGSIEQIRKSSISLQSVDAASDAAVLPLIAVPAETASSADPSQDLRARKCLFDFGIWVWSIQLDSVLLSENRVCTVK